MPRQLELFLEPVDLGFQVLDASYVLLSFDHEFCPIHTY
jgi:hypothetical protein